MMVVVVVLAEAIFAADLRGRVESYTSDLSPAAHRGPVLNRLPWYLPLFDFRYVLGVCARRQRQNMGVDASIIPS